MMNKLIKFELRRLFRNKAFYICLGISAGLILLNGLLTKSVSDSAGVETDPNSFILTFASNGMITMILGIFTAIFVTDDFTCGTMKNIYAKGYTRNQVYLAKYLASTISALCFLGVALILSSSASESLFQGAVTENNTFIASLVLEIIVILAYNSLFFAISLCMGKLGPAIALCIVGPSIVTLAFNLADSFLKQEDFKLASYWLDGCLSSLQTANCSSTVLVSSLVVSVLVAAISVIAGMKLNSKKEF